MPKLLPAMYQRVRDSMARDPADYRWSSYRAHAAPRLWRLTLTPQPSETNLEALALASRYSMHEVFGCARMYHGLEPGLA